MKVGIFSPYLETMGGGERYLLTVAEFFCCRGDQIDIFWSKDRDLAKIKDRFNLDLTGVNFRDNIFDGKMNLLDRLVQTMNYDLIFFLSDGSIPTSLAKKNILHFQTPFHYDNQNTLVNKLKLSRFSAVVCNSFFTKRYIDGTYDINSQVLYPPVDIDKFFPGKKENLILSVGHFYGDIRPKRQDIMVETFIKLGLPGWRLVLIGGAQNGAEREVNKLRKIAAGFPVEFVVPGPFNVLKDHYAKAKIYWHAAGYGADLEKFPEKAEHFGMSTVEAMAAGCVPIVFCGGGQKEIIVEGENGFFWDNMGELNKKTLKIVSDNNLREKIYKNAIARSKFFSKEKFFQDLEKLL